MRKKFNLLNVQEVQLKKNEEFHCFLVSPDIDTNTTEILISNHNIRYISPFSYLYNNDPNFIGYNNKKPSSIQSQIDCNLSELNDLKSKLENKTGDVDKKKFHEKIHAKLEKVQKKFNSIAIKINEIENEYNEELKKIKKHKEIRLKEFQDKSKVEIQKIQEPIDLEIKKLKKEKIDIGDIDSLEAYTEKMKLLVKTKEKEISEVESKYKNMQDEFEKEIDSEVKKLEKNYLGQKNKIENDWKQSPLFLLESRVKQLLLKIEGYKEKFYIIENEIALLEDKWKEVKKESLETIPTGKYKEYFDIFFSIREFNAGSISKIKIVMDYNKRNEIKNSICVSGGDENRILLLIDKLIEIKQLINEIQSSKITQAIAEEIIELSKSIFIDLLCNHNYKYLISLMDIRKELEWLVKCEPDTVLLHYNKLLTFLKYWENYGLRALENFRNQEYLRILNFIIMIEREFKHCSLAVDEVKELIEEYLGHEHNIDIESLVDEESIRIQIQEIEQILKELDQELKKLKEQRENFFRNINIKTGAILHLYRENLYVAESPDECDKILSDGK